MLVYIQPAIGGLLIGLSAVLLLGLNGRIAGISGIVSGVFHPEIKSNMWRAAFCLGLILGPVLVRNMLGYPVIGAPAASTPVLAIAGFLVGIGTCIGGGCTSGHGVCGLARLAPRSIAATATFMLTAILTVYVVRHVL